MPIHVEEHSEQAGIAGFCLYALGGVVKGIFALPSAWEEFSPHP